MATRRRRWPPLVVVGLTGGIASGKSTVAAFFAETGATVLNADHEGHACIAAGEPALAELISAFGSEYLLTSGELNRPALGQRIFATPADRATLNRITHPRIAGRLRAKLRALAAAPPSPPLVVVEAALLLEARWTQLVDKIVVVDTQPKTQVSRLTARLGLEPHQAEARLRAQTSRERRLQAADYVIAGEGALATTRERVLQVAQELLPAQSRGDGGAFGADLPTSAPTDENRGGV